MENSSVILLVVAIAGGLFLLWIILYLIPVGLWFQALVSDVKISLLQLVLMRWRKVPPTVIVSAMIEGKKAGIELYRDLLEGFVIYGALIGGFIGIVLYCHIWKMNLLSYLDLALPSVALAQGFGRIGCLLAGCCYGQETDSAFAITFHNSAYAPNGVPLIPTQIISSGLDFLHFFILLYFVKKWKKHDGQVTGLFIMLYSAGRYVLEYFRGDLERGSVGVLSTSQFIAIFMFVFGAVFFFGLSKKKAAVPTEVKKQDE